MQWSKYQKAIFEDVQSGKGHVFVEAVAGSGKTTALIESLNYVPENDLYLLIAFNKRIADELKFRAPYSYNGEIRTLHSLGLKAIKKPFPNVEVDSRKIWRILEEILGRNRKLIDVKMQMVKAIALSKACLISDLPDIDVLLDKYDIDTVDMNRDEFISNVNKAMLQSFDETDTVDFEDMIWYPNVYGLKIGPYDRVFCDEAQDLNPAQLEMAISACKKDGRITLYGDRSQSIYGFRSATIENFSKYIKRLNVKILPLSISYRCPTKVVAKAKELVPAIESAPSANEGIVDNISYKEMLKKAKPGCFILSRTNAPLIELAFGFIRQGVPCNIQGRDIGENLLNLIKKSKKRTLSSFLNWLYGWKEKEIKRLRKHGRPTTSITDKVGCLRALADNCSSIGEMKEKIQELFDDEDNDSQIILSTVHRAKGLERDIVFLLEGTFFGSGQEEKNIKYVAITRSASELYYVKGKGVK